MPDYYAQRLANLEAIVFAGIGSPAQAQVISVPGAAPIAIQNGGLVLIAAPGPVTLSLAPPTAVQNGFSISVLNANGFFNTVTGSFSSTGSPGVVFSSLADSGQVGNIAKLVAQNGVWALTTGSGWAGIGYGDS